MSARTGLAGFAAVVALGGAPPEVAAQSTAIDRMRESGVVRIGFRDGAMPFSWNSGGAAPHGYSIDLCHAIVEDLSRLAGKPLRVEYRVVTPETRLEAVTQGRIDLECGSTTVTFWRPLLISPWSSQALSSLLTVCSVVPVISAISWREIGKSMRIPSSVFLPV